MDEILHTKLGPGLDFDPLEEKQEVSAVASNDGKKASETETSEATGLSDRVMTLVELADKAHMALGAMREEATKALKETYGDTPENNLVITVLNEHLLRSTVGLVTMAQLGHEYENMPEYLKKKGS